MKTQKQFLLIICFFVSLNIQAQGVELKLHNLVNILELKGIGTAPTFKISQALGSVGELKINGNNLELNYSGADINLIPGTGDVVIGSKLNVADSPSNFFNPDAVGDIKYNSSTNDLEGFTADGWQSLTAGSNQNGNGDASWGNAGNCAQGIGLVSDYQQFFNKDFNSFFAGTEVDIDSNFAIVGHDKSWEPGGGGLAIILENQNGIWTEVAELSISASYPNYNFGLAIAINQEYAMVYGYRQDGSPSNARVFIYKKGASGWADMTETAVLQSPDNPSSGNFGRNMDMNENTLVISDGTNELFVYERNAMVWTYQAKLTNTSGVNNNGVYISEDNTILTGVGVFVKPLGGWINMGQNATLFSSTTAMPGDILDDRAVLIDDGDGNGSKEIIIFEKPPGGWSGNILKSQEIEATDYVPSSSFYGDAISLSGDLLLVGDPGYINKNCNDELIGRGRCHIYKYVTGQGFDYYSTITSPVPGGSFGKDVALDGDHFIIGSPWQPSQGKVVFGKIE